MSSMQSILLSFLLISCTTEIDNKLAKDNDGDGFTELEGDCDDDQPRAFPGAASLDSEVLWFVGTGKFCLPIRLL